MKVKNSRVWQISTEQKHLSQALFSLELFFSLFFGLIILYYFGGTLIISSIVFLFKVVVSRRFSPLPGQHY